MPKSPKLRFQVSVDGFDNFPAQQAAPAFLNFENLHRCGIGTHPDPKLALADLRSIPDRLAAIWLPIGPITPYKTVLYAASRVADRAPRP